VTPQAAPAYGPAEIAAPIAIESTPTRPTGGEPVRPRRRRAVA